MNTNIPICNNIEDLLCGTGAPKKAEEASQKAEAMAKDVADKAKSTAEDASKKTEDAAKDVANKAEPAAEDASKAVQDKARYKPKHSWLLACALPENFVRHGGLSVYFCPVHMPFPDRQISLPHAFEFP